MDEVNKNRYRSIAKELALNASASPSIVVDMKNITEALFAALADGQRAGLERAAKDAEQMRVQACSIRNETSIAFELLQKIEVRIQRIVELEKKIRQSAGEVQHG